jgi:glycosyltransferase involved in cell wall biosynthesis
MFLRYKWLDQAIKNRAYLRSNNVHKKNEREVGNKLISSNFSFLEKIFPEHVTSKVKIELGRRIGIAAQKLNLTSDQVELAYRIFYAPYYVSSSGLKVDTSEIEAFSHFLETGLSAKLSPSPLFQNDVYLANHGKNIDVPVSPFLHWLTIGADRGVLPTSRFNTRYYLLNYDDVRNHGVDPFKHFLQFGLREGRIPIFVCDIERYRNWQKKQISENGKAFLRFLFSGYEITSFENDLASETLSDQEVWPNTEKYVCRFDNLLSSLSPFEKKLNVQNLRHLTALFWLDCCDNSKLSQVESYICGGHSEKDDESSFFQANYYLAKLATLGSNDMNLPVLLHWLKYGFKNQIVPTQNFNEAFYLKTYIDIAKAKIWGFSHFIAHGRSEGRKPNQNAQLSLPDIPPNLMTYSEKKHFHRNFESAKHLTSSILRSSSFSETFAKLQHLECGIGVVDEYSQLVISTVHQHIGWMQKTIVNRVKYEHYDTIICVPWIRKGGADLVAGIITHGILRLEPNSKILIIQTDQPQSEWRDVFPPQLEVVDISDIVQFAGQDLAEQLVRAIFVGLAPIRIINVNSRLCWTIFQRFGKRLAESINLYAYLFCWDRNGNGARAGYPSDFYPETADFMSGIFTDSEYLKNELIRIYAPPSKLRNRLTILHTPGRSELRNPTAAALGSKTSIDRPQSIILWAGRLDRQKRFDLVIEIARLMPTVNFICWGRAMMDTPPDLSQLPTNIEMKSHFADYLDLPLGDCDGWLYTSEWDGMPTLLIELAHHGMPIVASSIEGVCELIDEHTGWPVQEWNEPNAYVVALEQMIADPAQRAIRGRQLQEKVSINYSTKNFDKELKTALGKKRH